MRLWPTRYNMAFQKKMKSRHTQSTPSYNLHHFMKRTESRRKEKKERQKKQPNGSLFREKAGVRLSPKEVGYDHTKKNMHD